MSIAVQIPMPLRSECGGKTEIAVSAATVRAALERLEQDYPALYRSVCDETGAVRRHVSLFVNNTFLHQDERLDAVLDSGDTLTIMPAVSGG